MTTKLGGVLIAALIATSVGGTPEPGRGVLFEDTFDDDHNGWGIVDSEFGSATYADGDYVWELRGSMAHWLAEALVEQYDHGELDMLDVTVHAEATIDAGDGVIGVFCRENPDTDAEWQWYEFVARDGFAAIRKADSEGNLDVLADTDDVDLPMGEAMTIEATCVDDSDGTARLTLRLDDTAMLEATDDDPLVNGPTGLQGYTFPIHEPIDVRWHHFAVTAAAAAEAAATASTEQEP